MYDQAAVDVQLQTLTTVSPPSPCPFITGQIKIELTNLTLLPSSPYRLIIGQIEVDLINLEDEFNSQLPINLVAASLYLTLILYTYRREKRKRRTCVTVKMTERLKHSEVKYPLTTPTMFAASLYRLI